MICCLRGLWTPVKLCPLPSCPNLLPSVCPSRSCCCLSTRGSNTTSMGTGRPTLSVRWEFRYDWKQLWPLKRSNMVKVWTLINTRGNKVSVWCASWCDAVLPRSLDHSVTALFCHFKVGLHCSGKSCFCGFYFEILVVDKRTYELLKESLFDLSKPSSETWRARGQHLIQSTDGSAVHTFHYF